jgi:hypothetical protein
MVYFVNREQIIYLEALPDQGEKPFWVKATRSAPVETTLSGFSAAPPGRQLHTSR